MPLDNGQTQVKLTSLEVINKLVALIPPRVHRHRYYAVLTSNNYNQDVPIDDRDGLFDPDYEFN